MNQPLDQRYKPETSAAKSGDSHSAGDAPRIHHQRGPHTASNTHQTVLGRDRITDYLSGYKKYHKNMRLE